MPSNVSIEFANAQKKYDAANSPMEKLVALQEMRSTAPSHKGAEKLRADISRKIAKLKNEIERQQATAKKKGSGASIAVRKEGAGQVAIVGMPNTGKSTLLNMLSNATVDAAPYAFTTTKPEVGMMDFEGAKVQLVEIPALVQGSSKGKAQGTQLLAVIRNADALIIMHRNNKEKYLVVNELEKSKIKVNISKPGIEIKPAKFKGIRIAGKKYLKIEEEKLSNFLKSLGMHNCEVLLSEPLKTLDSVGQVLDESIVYKKALFLKPGELKDTASLKKEIFSLLGKVLVYTKKPGKEAEMDNPLVLKKGSTVEQVAGTVHKEIAQKLRYVRVWGSTKFPGQRVAKEYILKNGDIVEIT